MITSREEVTRRIVATKIQQNLKWADVAKALGQSKEWTTATCLGQMQLTKKEATQLGELFQLDDEALGIYGPALKELIHEEFGDGIMSAIDFTVSLDREFDPMGDRVKMIWSGKFLPYKKF